MAEIIDPNHQSRDVRLVASAIRRGWNIPQAIMDALPAKMAEIVETSDDERSQVAAAKVLVAMHAQNQKDKPVTRKVRHLHQLGPAVPVTEDNLEQRRAFLLSRLTELGDDSGTNRGN